MSPVRTRLLLAPVALALLQAGCTGGTRPPSPADSPLGVTFVDRAAEAGLDFRHTDGSSGSYFIVETLASGVLLLDFDEDGDLDIYLINGRPLPPSAEGNAKHSNALYRNAGDGTFRDVTAEMGIPGTGFGGGGVAGDYDGDGDLDIYICQYGPDVLYRNEGKAGGYRFTDVTARAGANDPRFSAGAAFFDMDRDGDLDLYVTNYCREDFKSPRKCGEGAVVRYCAPSTYEPEGDSLFMNRGDGTFEDITASSGIAAMTDGRGMGVVATDFDRDGWMDIFVANDASENFLLRNLGNRKFEDVGLSSGVALSASGDENGNMGVDVADFNRDGRLDIFVTTYQKQLNALYRSEAKGIYNDVAMAHGLGETCLPMVSWGTKFFDFDNDGWLDLFIANGHLEDAIEKYDQSSTYLQERQLFRNLGGGMLKEVSAQAGPAFQARHSSRGAAFGDLDNDGDVDIVVSNSRGTPSLLRNEGGNRKSWILIELAGKRNRHGIGALVKVTAGGVSQIAEQHSGASYCSMNDLRLHFGLGDAALAESVEVEWPEGLRETFENLTARKVHRLVEGTGRPADRPWF